MTLGEQGGSGFPVTTVAHTTGARRPGGIAAPSSGPRADCHPPRWSPLAPRPVAAIALWGLPGIGLEREVLPIPPRRVAATPRPIAGKATALLILALAGALFLAQHASAVGERIDVVPTDILEGERFRINVVGGIADVIEEVVVTCDACERVYRATVKLTSPVANLPDQRSATIQFPDQFEADAVALQEPRWNGVYRAFVSTDGTEVDSDTEDTVRVWAADAFRGVDPDVHPTEVVTFSATGFTPGATVRLSLEKYDVHRDVVLVQRTDLMAEGGRVQLGWRVPKAWASEVTCPGLPERACEIHWATFEGPGKKAADRVQFRVVKTPLMPIILASPSDMAGTDELQRASVARATIRVPYATEWVRASDLPPSAPTLRVVVQEIVGVGDAPPTIRNVSDVRSQAVGSVWVAEWDIPRDLEPPIPGQTRYRFAVAEQHDRYGHVILANVTSAFEVVPATIDARFRPPPANVERRSDVNVSFVALYPNGSAFTDLEGPSELRVSVLRIDRDPASGADKESPVAELNATFNATLRLWSATWHVPRNHSGLTGHVFEVHAVEDADGNTLRANRSGRFVVDVARPRIALRLLVNGTEVGATEGLMRQQRAFIVADIHYADGTPVDSTVIGGRARAPVATVGPLARDSTLLDSTNITLRPDAAVPGRWAAPWSLPKDAPNVPGLWLVRVQVHDDATPANENATRIERPMRGAEIRVVPFRNPPPDVAAGQTASFVFRLLYPDGTTVSTADIGGSILATVWRLSNGTPAALVARIEEAEVEPGQDAWRVSWRTFRELPGSDYAFIVEGQDRHGNPVAPARSLPFHLRLPGSSRFALIEPPPIVVRGAAVEAAFEAREGDTGPAGGRPVLALERFEEPTGAWQMVAPDVHRGGLDANGTHAGLFETALDTPLARYRFRLEGTDARGQPFRANSSAFTVVPARVTRQVVEGPGAELAKGVDARWVVALQEGDGVESVAAVDVLGDEVRSVPPSPRLEAGPVLNVTWRPPFGLAVGSYTLMVKGVDRHGNRLMVEMAPARLAPIVLQPTILAAPDHALRGDRATLLFRVAYPDGTPLRMDVGAPTVVVSAPGVTSDAVEIREDDGVWNATWAPEPRLPLGTYRFRVEGGDSFGNVVIPLESTDVPLGAGTVARRVAVEVPAERSRLDRVIWEIERSPDDVDVSFVLHRQGSEVAVLPYRLDEEKGTYVVQWTAARDAPVGTYRIEFRGVDRYGNALTAVGGTFALRPAELSVLLKTRPGPILPGQVAVWTFDVLYPDNTPFTPVEGTPLSGVLRRSEPMRPLPTLGFRDGEWVALWASGEDAKRDVYLLVVGGTDRWANGIRDFRAPELIIWYGYAKEAFGVPALPPLAALAVLAVAALAMRRRG